MGQGYLNNVTGYGLVELNSLWEDATLCHSRISQHFMEPEGSLPCSQVSSTSSYHEPDKSSPSCPIVSLLRSVLWTGWLELNFCCRQEIFLFVTTYRLVLYYAQLHFQCMQCLLQEQSCWCMNLTPYLPCNDEVQNGRSLASYTFMMWCSQNTKPCLYRFEMYGVLYSLLQTHASVSTLFWKLDPCVWWFSVLKSWYKICCNCFLWM
jgi:hypothetical protein